MWSCSVTVEEPNDEVAEVERNDVPEGSFSWRHKVDYINSVCGHESCVVEQVKEDLVRGQPTWCSFICKSGVGWNTVDGEVIYLVQGVREVLYTTGRIFLRKITDHCLDIGCQQSSVFGALITVLVRWNGSHSSLKRSTEEVENVHWSNNDILESTERRNCWVYYVKLVMFLNKVIQVLKFKFFLNFLTYRSLRLSSFLSHFVEVVGKVIEGWYLHSEIQTMLDEVSICSLFLACTAWGCKGHTHLNNLT